MRDAFHLFKRATLVAALVATWAFAHGPTQHTALGATPLSHNVYLPIVLVPGAALPAPSATIQLSITATSLTATALPAASVSPATSPATATLAPTATQTATPSPTATSGTAFTPVGPNTPTRTPASKPIYTNGQDLWNCSDFGSWDDADVVYRANLPGDPNGLDQDSDGIACEMLPGAPASP